MKKRAFCAVLCLALMLGLLPTALAEEAPAPVQVPAETSESPAEEPQVPVGTSEPPAEEPRTPTETSADPAGEMQDPAGEPQPAGQVQPPAEPQPEGDGVERAEVVVDGVTVETFQAQLLSGVSYVPVAAAVQALYPDSVAAVGEGELTVTGEGLSLTVERDKLYLEVNGRYLYLPDGVETDSQGTLLVPVRVLARALGAGVDWDGRVLLTGGGTPLEPGDTYYKPFVVELMSKTIMHESGNQSLRGKIAVGNVILNRVNSAIFPNTVYDVLFQKNQFPGATKVKSVNDESVIAAKLALDGAMVVPGACWFNRKGLSCWASRHKSLIATIGGHDFYG